MRTMKTDVTAFGIKFDVEYYASVGRPGTRWEPPEPDELSIESIYIGETEVSEVLLQGVTDAIYEQLEKDICAEARQCQEDAAEERADYNHDMMRGYA